MTGAPETRYGNDPGWHLALSRGSQDVLAIGCEQYHATIEASLPHGLAGGSYVFTIEGLTNEDYQLLAGAFEPTEVLEARLYLYWRDVNSGVLGYLANIGGFSGASPSLTGEAADDHLVAVLAVTEVTRVAKPLRYDAVVRARELVYHRLATHRTAEGIAADSPLEAAKELAIAAGLSIDQVEVFPPEGGDPDAGQTHGEREQLPVRQSTVQVLHRLGERMAAQYARWGRGMYRIRRGILEMGPRRPIPTMDFEVTDLSATDGVLNVAARGWVARDPSRTDAVEAGQEGAARRRWELTLRGHPGLGPGDVVSFVPPLGEQPPGSPPWYAPGVLGLLAPGQSAEQPAAILGYVEGVTHSVGRGRPFVTRLACVEVTRDDVWDERGQAHADDPEQEDAVEGSPTVAGELARAVRRSGAETFASRHQAEIGEVRATHGAGGEGVPGQTSDYLRGVQTDGGPRQARRAKVERVVPDRQDRVPYVTPFALGPFGLVLPRYPGTRTLLVHRQGLAEDPIDIGALWPTEGSDQAGPNTAKPGDWWLSLPAKPEPVAELEPRDDADAVQLEFEFASNDLIDAQGRRYIDTAELVIRVGTENLARPGERPTAEPGVAVLIEHIDKSSRIEMRTDGTIAIEAASDLILQAGGHVKVKVGKGKTFDVEESA